MSAKLDKFRALHARWLDLCEAAYYCGFSINHFNKAVRPLVCEHEKRPVVFDRLELDKVMESKKIGNLPGNRVLTSTAKGGK
jgi:hypothetical protein